MARGTSDSITSQSPRPVAGEEALQRYFADVQQKLEGLDEEQAEDFWSYDEQWGSTYCIEATIGGYETEILFRLRNGEYDQPDLYVVIVDGRKSNLFDREAIHKFITDLITGRPYLVGDEF